MSDISYPLNALVGAPQPVKPVTPDETEAQQFEQPGWGKLFGAAFRTENMVGSALSQEEVENPYRKQDGFDWLARYNSLPEEMRVLHGDKFTDIHNDRSFDALEAKITRENADKQLLASSGWRGTVASITAGLADLPTLIPVGGEYMAAARGIKGVSLAAARFAAENAGAQAVQEVGLHATQETRTATDSAINVGAGAVLGFMLGGAGAALLTRGEREIAESAITRVLDPAADAGEVPGSAASVGAAAVDRLSREENTPAGTIGKALTQVSQINPNNRLNMSASNAAREIGQQLGDNAIYQVAHEAEKTLGPSAEIAARVSMQGRMAEGLEVHQSIWKEYRKANGAWLLGRGSSMTAEEFDNAVGRAMRRGDVAESGDQYVTKAAQEWRRKVFDPLKKEAIDAGLLPPDVATETADSYLHRWWNKQALMQNEREAKGVFRDYFIERLTGLAAADEKVAKELSDARAIREYAEDAASAVYDKLTGRVFDEAVADIPDWIVPVVRGPLKERTFNIPDALVEKYLNSNIRDVAHKYARTMAADIELTRKFGRADMRDQIQRIVADYQDMRDKVYAAKTVEEARKVVGDTPGIGDWLREKRGSDALGVAKEKLVSDLNKAERADLNDVKSVRDLVRGTYGKDQNETWRRISNAATAYNYIRLMGGNVIANMSDIYRPAMVHGLLPYFRDAVLPLMTNMKAVKLSIEEARKAGLVAERIMQSRLMSFAEIGDRYASDTAFERLMQNGAKIASRWNGILHLTDFNQAMASVLTQDRMISAMLEGKEGRYLAYLGIDKNMAQRIGKQLEAHAENVNGVWVANTDKWADPHGVLARTYRAAMRKDVDSIIVQRSAGDVPLFANTPTGKMLLQFKAFNLAAHQRVLIRSTQEGPANFVSGLVGMTSLGIMASYLRAYRGGDDRWQKFQQAAQNPGYLIGEGLDLSGLFTLGFEPVNIAEKVFKTNVVKDPIKAAFGDPNVGESQRYSSRGIIASFLGPSASAIDLTAEVAQRAAKKSAGESTASNDVALMKQSAQLLPYYSYFGVREVLNHLIGH